MSTETPLPLVTSSPQPRRWTGSRLLSWRFSIRELLLLTTAVAALVAVFLAYYRESQPFQTSQLIKEFGAGSHIRAVAAAVHPQPVIFNGGGGGGGDGQTMTLDYSYTIGLPPALRGPFMARLERDAQKMLRDRPRGTGSITRGTSFTLRYHGGPSRGVLVVRRVDLNDEEMHLSILIYEHEEPR